MPNECCSDAAWKKMDGKSFTRQHTEKKKRSNLYEKQIFLIVKSSNADTVGWWLTRPTKPESQCSMSLEWD